MDGLLIAMIQEHGWGALAIGLVAYLLLESLLDVISGLIGEWVRRKLGRTS